MYNHNQNIKQLLSDCLKGKQSAQLEIYKCYYKAMYNIALRILNDSFEAEDIMQESFLTAFSKLSTFKAESEFDNEKVPFGSWLKRIVINKSLTQLKKNKNIQNWNDSNVEVTNLSVIEEDTTLKTDYNTRKAKEVLHAIKKLKDNYKVVLTLSLIEGFDNDEIATILKTNNQSVRTTISRAKNKLRRELIKS